MSIASFKIDEADQTANVSPTMRFDINGEKCALIKIATTQKNFSFDVGSLGITHTEWQNSEHPGEIWLYVPNGVMKISIQHPQFGSIKDYDLGGRLKRGRTYVMDLTSDQINTLIIDYDNSKNLTIEVTPRDAEFYLNGLRQNLDFNGRASITLPFGTHTYRVVAENYHPEESQIVINDNEYTQKLSVNLKKAFGYLTIDPAPEFRGSELFIDSIRVGNTPIYRHPLKSGKHKITLFHKLYLPYNDIVMMTDSAMVSINPEMEPNYAEYEIIVEGDKDAQIYDNGELLGTGYWKGRIGAGEHTIEAKKLNHTTITQHITVRKYSPGKVSMMSPQPIYGALEIKTQPSNAEVYIDNNSKAAGITNFMSNRLLIGSHHVKVVLTGHKTEEFDIDIKEGQTEHVSLDLTDYCNFILDSSPTAMISIDGEKYGLTPKRINLVAGTYNIRLSKDGYCTTSKRMHLDSKTKDLNIKLHNNYVRLNELYLQGGFNMGNTKSLSLGIGCFIHNINFEGNYIFGISNNERILWEDKTEASVPFIATYKSSGCNIKIGYGIRLNRLLRLTPQVGGRFIKLREAPVEGPYFEYQNAADGANVISLSIGLRSNLAIAKCLGISISPEYFVGCIKSDGFKALSEVSSQINSYANGFNLSINLNIYF